MRNNEPVNIFFHDFNTIFRIKAVNLPRINAEKRQKYYKIIIEYDTFSIAISDKYVVLKYI